MEKPAFKACLHCGEPFRRERGNKRYCSRSCCYKAWYKRHGHRPSVKAARKKSYEKHREKRIAYSKKWSEENKDRRRVNMRRYQVGLYGLTLGEFDEMLQRQRGRCPICTEVMRPPCVDHNHNTYKVRGLLCRGCNQGLGLLRDKTDNLQRAIAYLERTPPR